MRIAILIVGELRTFEFTRKSFTFLDKTTPGIDTDIYVHTWNESTTSNTLRVYARNFHKSTCQRVPVTKDQVQEILGVPATIVVSPPPNFTPCYPMVMGWIAGMELIQKSGKDYDYVYVLRPDLFFKKEQLFDLGMIRENFENKNVCGFMSQPNDNLLDDTTFFASYSAMSSLLSQQLLDYINLRGYGGWHDVWYDYVTKILGMQITHAPVTGFTHCITRWPIDHSYDFENVQRTWSKWQLSQELISINVIGDWNDFKKTRHNFEFLHQDDLCAQNLFFFQEETHHKIEGTSFRNDLYNRVEEVREFYQEGYTWPGWPSGNMQRSRMVKFHDVTDPLERLLKYWHEIVNDYNKLSYKPHYTFIVNADLIFDKSARLELQSIWGNIYGTPDMIGLSVNDQGQFTIDSLFGPTFWLENLFNNQTLLQKWPQAKAEGRDFISWWNEVILEYRPYAIPLNTQVFSHVTMLDATPASYDNSKKVKLAIDEYVNKIIPWLNTSHATPEIRQLHIPDILKQNYALRNMLVIFDLDGVLLESKEMHYETLNEALSLVSNEFVISHKDHLQHFDGRSTKTKLKMLTQERGLPESMHEQIWHNKQLATIRWLKNMNYLDNRLNYLMRNLKAQNCTIAVASNSIRATVKTALLYMNLIDEVDYFVSNEDVKHPKPHPEIFWRCMIDLGFIPDNTIVVEDSEVGLRAARACGAKVVRVGNPSEVQLHDLEQAAKELKGLR